MATIKNYHGGNIHVNEAFEGDTLEHELESYRLQGQNVNDLKMIHGAIPTKRADGVKPEYNIRTDRWEIAQHAMQIANMASKEQGNARSLKLKGNKTAETNGTTQTKEIGQAEPQP